jgi:peptide deformylase
MKLVYHPHPSLLKQVQEFDFNKLEAKDIEKQMIEIMNKQHGVGLSANQVDLDAQIFVMEPKDLEGYKDGESFAVINPRIEAVSEQTVLGEEGCLSFPGLFFKVKRAEALVAKFLDSNGKECKIEFKGWNARIFQHEFDHLYGINYIDRVSKMKLDMAKKKQQKYFKKIKGMITYG